MPVAIRKAIVQSAEQKTDRGEKKRNREGEGRETDRERERGLWLNSSLEHNQIRNYSKNER